eukprot:scaffold7071_cov260-Pinguiococcus_pyrenoidosus.AAC.3
MKKTVEGSDLTPRSIRSIARGPAEVGQERETHRTQCGDSSRLQQFPNEGNDAEAIEADAHDEPQS